jgi:(1->4)-alpha-D-glucan 1-alpha-D-glucosylmutase
MQKTHPATMTTLSTHDTKRSDDVRARLAVLSEIPQEFANFLNEASHLNAQFKQQQYPDPNTEYFLYQTLIGAWPIDAERAKTYMMKAVHEAKQQTSWVVTNQPFEDAVNAFIDSILAHQPFIEELEKIVARVLLPGRINSLTQTLVKNTAPGVPDLYQGGELWDLSLVDPDNRRPVDYKLRRKLLSELPRLSVEQVMARMEEGLPKLHLINRALHLRKDHPEWFGPDAAYLPLEVTGKAGANVIAYARGENVITIAPRLSLDLDWAETSLNLPEGLWENVLTQESGLSGEIKLEDLLRNFPVALLTRNEVNKENQHDA